MILKHLKQPIIAQITVLVGFVLFSLAGLKAGNILLEQRQNYLQGLVKNEQIKVEISHVLQKKLFEINVKIHDLANVNSASEMNRIFRRFETLRHDVDRTLEVLHQGGEWVESYPVNFGGEEIITRQLTYKNYQIQKIDLQLIELTAKLTDLDQIVEQFSAVIKLKIKAFEKRDAQLVAEAVNRVSQHYKGIEPFFVRILENSYRLHFESQQEMERIHAIHAGFVRRFNSVENTSGIVMAGLILLLGSFVLRSSRRILNERDGYQLELVAANENLEKKVQVRTLELEKEVAERKQAEDHVADQAAFLLNIIESLGHPFCVINADNYEIVLANTAAGLTVGKETMTCHALSHHQLLPCSRQEHPCHLQIVKKTGKPVVLEHVHTNSHGEKITVEVHGYPVFDPSGKLIQMIEYTLDMTAKKKAEKALLEAKEQLEDKVKERTSALEEQIFKRKKAQLTLIKSERHFRRLIENISDIITIVDAAGMITYTSPSAESILGFSPSDVIGQDVRNLIKPEDMTYLDMHELYAKYQAMDLMRYRVVTPDGSYRVLESLIRKFEQDDGSEAYILNSRDVTTRVEAEEETRKLRLVIEQSPDSIVITDTEGRIEFVNAAFEETTGYRSAEVIGKNPRILQSGKTPAARFTQLWKTISRGKVWQGEFVNKKKNGEHYEENVLIVPIKNLHGEITNYAAVKENITELRRAQKQAVSANQAKSIFLSRMSHELRTPLNAINGFSQLMLKSKKHPLTEKQRHMAEQILSAGDHLLQLINEVLDLARIESGEFTLSLEPVDPQQILRECLSLAQPLADNKSITLINRCSGHHFPFIRADQTRTKQVLLNLLSNAVKYNHQGGTVEISTALEDAGFLRFAVSDNGLGIAEDKHKDVFMPFTRMVDNPDAIEGTGIGMTITKQLVEHMGGEIGFESRLGEGSRFWFVLPLCTKKVPLEQVEASLNNGAEIEKAESSDEHLKHLLYIEDNPTNISFMREVVDDIGGFTLEIADSGEAGIQAAINRTPDLILLDLNLPGIDGFQVYRQLKAQPETEFVPVVVVSADAMEKTVKKIEKFGFNGYLSKPVKIDLLKKTLTETLGVE
ncbi:MAG: PAS domain S-box protein [Desulfuromonadales bacterium]|nr:PAS domain S-box protein [Desulfuromonadales bacterium]MBN2792352.1 PAS domain S-box protein [Desulfuromonadales bacterium]